MSEVEVKRTEVRIKRRYPLLAVFLSIVVPGAGQFYNKQIKRAGYLGLVWLAGNAIVLTPAAKHVWGLSVAVALIFGSYLYGIVQSGWRAFKFKEVEGGRYHRWYPFISTFFTLAVISSYMSLALAPIEAFRIPTGSMEPTIEYGEFIIADRGYYSSHSIAQGDLAIFYYPTDSVNKYISRCLAVGGDTVEIRDRVPYVDGTPVPSPGYSLAVWQPMVPRSVDLGLIFPPGAGNSDNYGPVIVPKGKCFMLSDNIWNAMDSRFKGFVDPKRLVARPLYIYWSSRPSRIGKELR